MNKRRLWEILEVAEAGDTPSKIFDIIISCVIGIAVVSVILESVPELGSKYAREFSLFEWGCLAVFIPEYLMRLWSCKSDARFLCSFGRAKWAFTAMALTDLAAILPSLFWFCGLDLRFLRAVRLMRIMRLAGYNRGMRVLTKTISECKGQLYVCLSGVLILLLIVSNTLYFVEREANPRPISTL